MLKGKYWNKVRQWHNLAAVAGYTTAYNYTPSGIMYSTDHSISLPLYKTPNNIQGCSVQSNTYPPQTWTWLDAEWSWDMQGDTGQGTWLALEIPGTRGKPEMGQSPIINPWRMRHWVTVVNLCASVCVCVCVCVYVCVSGCQLQRILLYCHIMLSALRGYAITLVYNI